MEEEIAEGGLDADVLEVAAELAETVDIGEEEGTGKSASAPRPATGRRKPG